MSYAKGRFVGIVSMLGQIVAILVHNYSCTCRKIMFLQNMLIVCIERRSMYMHLMFNMACSISVLLLVENHNHLSHPGICMPQANRKSCRNIYMYMP